MAMWRVRPCIPLYLDHGRMVIGTFDVRRLRIPVLLGSMPDENRDRVERRCRRSQIRDIHMQVNGERGRSPDSWQGIEASLSTRSARLSSDVMLVK